MDLERYTVILEECKLLNINNFLYNISPCMVNRTLLLQHATSNNVSDSSCPTVVPRRRLIEREIFGFGEMAWERSFAPHQDIPNLGTLFGEGSHKFD